MPEWFWDLPLTWRFKYKQYHDQWIEPEPEPEEHTLPDVDYEVAYGDLYYNPYKGGRFRCPYCGQAHELKFTYDARDLTIKQNKQLTERYIEEVDKSSIVHQTFKYEEGSESYDQLITKVFNEMDVACWTCRKTAPKWRWTHAFDKPLLYFQTEEICHCGGELYYQKIVGTDSFGMVCEKCGDYDKNKRMSGSADAEVR